MRGPVNFACAAALVLLAARVDGAARVQAPAPDDAAPATVGFAVQRFDNLDRVALLAPLEVGLPAVIAERLAAAAPLRFVGPPLLLPVEEQSGAGPLRGAARVDEAVRVAGRFARVSGMQLRVQVDLLAASGPGQGTTLASAALTGARDQAAALGLAAARAAFAQLPDLAPGWPAGPERPEQAPFARDGYAFLLYARGLAAALRLEASAPPGRRRAARSEDAFALLTRALVIDPRAPETRRLLGELHRRAGRPGHARTQWVLALESWPRAVLALRALAALDREAAPAGAIASTRRLLAIDPGDLDARRALGELLHESGQLEAAQTELEAVLAGRPGDLSARRTLTLVLSARRAGVALVQELEAVVRLQPDDLDARLDLAAARLAGGDAEGAARACADLLARAPRHVAALKLAGDIARTRGRLDEAVAHYTLLRRVLPADPRPVFLLGELYARAGNLRAARRMFEDAAALPGYRPEAYANLGALALQEGEIRQARWFLERAARARPEHVPARFNHALALRELDRPVEALGEVRAAERLAPGEAGLPYLAGLLALRLGLLQEAALDFARVLQLQPDHEDARHNLDLLRQVLSPRNEGAASAAPTAVGAQVSAMR